MNRIPGTGELYRDLTNHIYQIVAAATDAQTGEKLIIYQALYGDYGVYVRPLVQFAGEGEDGQCLFEKIDKAENQSDRRWAEQIISLLEGRGNLNISLG